MIQINRAFETVLNKHYVCPKGVMGRFVGELMVRQHEKETSWTVSIANVQPTDHVLEIGFGAGKAIQLLAKQTTHGFVYGIDLSATMVKRAKERNAHAVRAGQGWPPPLPSTCITSQPDSERKTCTLGQYSFGSFSKANVAQACG
jgi:SAM-dependent methyltransferase